MASSSNAEGYVVFRGFGYGKYILRETKAPDGYMPAEDIPVTIDGTWNYSAEAPVIINIPDHYEFRKVNHLGEPMEGVKFTLEDETGKVLQTAVSDTNGIVRFAGLSRGRYIIRETETLEGYVLSEETLSVVIDEKYVPAAEPVTYVNYPVIQTGVEFTMNSTMWIGAILIVLSAALMFCLIRKRRKMLQDSTKR